MKPEGYPLPWCEEFDCAYWQINLALCMGRLGWKEWQKPLSMLEIIPKIDELIAAGEIVPN